MLDPFKTSLVALMMTGAMPAMAQDGQMPADTAKPYQHKAPAHLSVSGVGEVSHAPDLAILSVGVSAQADTAQAAMADNAARLSQVIDKLTAAGMDKKDMQTTGLSLSPQQDYSLKGKPPKTVGYEARNMLVLRVNDLAGLGATLDGLVDAGANEINNIQFALKDTSKIMDEAREAAMKDAIHKASILAAAAGQKLGPVVSISEGGAGDQPPMPVMRAMMDEGSMKSTSIEGGEITQRASVQVVFTIMPDDTDHKTVPDMGHKPKDDGTPAAN